jgi:protein TonB
VRYHPVIMIGGHSVLLGLPRRWGVLACVVLLHVVALWWLQQGLMRDVPPLITPVTLLSVSLDKPEPVAAPAPQPRPEPTRVPPAPRQASVPDKPVLAPSPAPVLSSSPSVSPPAAPAPEPLPSPGASPSSVVPSVGGRTGTSSVGASNGVVLPSTSAAYLNNPPPVYPRMSERLGEQGVVRLRVLVGTDGLPQQVELETSSGYDRLDRAALDAVKRWRFVPGRRGDTPETMWVRVPIDFRY